MERPRKLEFAGLSTREEGAIEGEKGERKVRERELQGVPWSLGLSADLCRHMKKLCSRNESLPASTTQGDKRMFVYTNALFQAQPLDKQRSGAQGQDWWGTVAHECPGSWLKISQGKAEELLKGTWTWDCR